MSNTTPSSSKRKRGTDVHNGSTKKIAAAAAAKKDVSTVSASATVGAKSPSSSRRIASLTRNDVQSSITTSTSTSNSRSADTKSSVCRLSKVTSSPKEEAGRMKGSVDGDVNNLVSSETKQQQNMSNQTPFQSLVVTPKPTPRYNYIIEDIKLAVNGGLIVSFVLMVSLLISAYVSKGQHQELLQRASALVDSHIQDPLLHKAYYQQIFQDLIHPNQAIELRKSVDTMRENYEKKVTEMELLLRSTIEEKDQLASQVKASKLVIQDLQAQVNNDNEFGKEF